MEIDAKIMERARAKARKVCQGEGWPSDIDSLPFRRLCDIIYTTEVYNIEPNNVLLHNEQVIKVHPVFPRMNTVALKILIACFMQDAPTEEIRRYSDQPAATVRDLKDKYFMIFKKRGRQATFRDDSGKICRRIEGCNTKLALERMHAAKGIDSAVMRAFRQVCHDPLTGNKRDIEIDHRKPRKAYEADGEVPPEPDSDKVDDGTFFEYFRPLSKFLNDKKRGVCGTCLEGKEIYLPDFVDHNAYKHERGIYDVKPTCVGCWWHNPALPLHPEFLLKQSLDDLKKIQDDNENLNKLRDALRREKDARDKKTRG